MYIWDKLTFSFTVLVQFFFKIYLLSLYSNLGNMRQVDDIPCPQKYCWNIVEILTKFRRCPTFFFSLAALYAALKFLTLFLHCVTVFSGLCLSAIASCFWYAKLFWKMVGPNYTTLKNSLHILSIHHSTDLDCNLKPLFFLKVSSQSFYWKEFQNQTKLMKYKENLISTHQWFHYYTS